LNDQRWEPRHQRAGVGGPPVKPQVR
jgi:hypothetical protein